MKAPATSHVVAYDVRATSPAQPRVAAVARELARRGSRVVLWCAHEPGSWARQCAEVRLVPDPVLKVYERWFRPAPEVPEESQARSPRWSPLGLVRGLGQRVQQTVLFPDNQAIWSARVRRRLVPGLVSGDLVVTCSRPESVGSVGEAAKRRGALWWFDFADGWCFQGLRAAAMQPGARRDRELSLERRWVRGADAVSTVHEELAGWFAGVRGGDSVLVLPNIVPDELVPPAARERRAPPAELAFGHFGRLSLSDAKCSFDSFVAMLRAAEEPALRFVFRGDYSQQELREMDALRALGHRVEVGEPVPRPRLSDLVGDLDGLLLILGVDQRGSSSKLLDALGLELPVFAFVDPESVAARIVRDAQCGEVAPAGDPANAVGVWRDYVGGVRAGRYSVDGEARFRHTSAAHVPAAVDRVLQLREESGRLPSSAL